MLYEIKVKDRKRNYVYLLLLENQCLNINKKYIKFYIIISLGQNATLQNEIIK